MFQVIYPASVSNDNEIHEFFKIDSDALKAIGIMVGTKPLDIATSLMYRGFTVFSKEKYPSDKRFINTYNECKKYKKVGTIKIKLFVVKLTKIISLFLGNEKHSNLFSITFVFSLLTIYFGKGREIVCSKKIQRSRKTIFRTFKIAAESRQNH